MIPGPHTLTLGLARADTRRKGRMEFTVNEAFLDLYKGYELHCSPQELQDGRWSPALLICRSEGAHRDERMMSISGGPFDSKRDAAVAARGAGRRWVDAQG